MDKNETIIGKDVIELLTLAMYEDSRFIYREYIQNSADQIDTAVEENILKSIEDGKIEIDINSTVKTISVLDNATGIRSADVQTVLKNVAQSTKDRAKHKGFRGIGRLGGLAYCNKLIFETSYKQESIKSILIWDSQKLKAIINNRQNKEHAIEVIDDVTEFHTEVEESEIHYFKVILEGVTNEELLDKENIREYLSMVAPVAYSKGFIYKSEIHRKATEIEYLIEEYPIFVNQDQVFKSYTSSIYKSENGSKSKIDEIYEIETYELRNVSNRLLGWGWYGISKFEKAIPSINIARGIRFRKGNIQIGSEETAVKLFKEPRGSKYYFGEVFIISTELIPNGRRDYFEENEELKSFEKLIRNKFDELHKLYYFSSKVRNEKKKIDDFASFTEEFKEKTKKGGFTDNEEKKKYQEKFEIKKEKAIAAKEELKKIEQRTESNVPAQIKLFKKVVGEDIHKPEDVDIDNDDYGKTKYLTDDIARLNRKDRKLVSKILSVIDSVLMKEMAENLKHKIIEELNK